MKVIKKLVSVLMAGVLTLSVMACSGTDKNKTARELDIETCLLYTSDAADD